MNDQPEKDTDKCSRCGEVREVKFLGKYDGKPVCYHRSGCRKRIRKAKSHG